jgi:uncharacterized protein YbjQ (UPF0145 family)
MVELTAAGKEISSELATLIEGRIVGNITDNGQIDTGFMVNSVYSISSERDSYNEALVKAMARAVREMSPKASLAGADALVAVGAEYAIWQEMRKSFAMKAIDQTKKDIPDIVKRVSMKRRLE